MQAFESDLRLIQKQQNNQVMLTIISIVIIGYLIKKNGIDSLYRIENPFLSKVVLIMLKLVPAKFLAMAS